jgi:hypothetical protein
VTKRFAALLWTSLCLCEGAHAQTSVRCDEEPTTALGTAVALANPGAILAITGFCQEQVTISSVLQSGITITNDTGLTGASLSGTDGIEGQLVISGPIQVTIVGLTLEGSSSDLGYPSVVSVLGSNVAIANSNITSGWRNGLIVAGNGVATILNTSVTGNGAANIAGQCDGIRASDGGRVFLGEQNPDSSIDTANAVTLENNACNGVSILSGSGLTVAGGTIAGNGGIEVFVDGSSAASVFGATIEQQATPNVAEAAAVDVFQTSRLFLAQGTTVDAGAFGSGVMVGSASSLATVNTTISNDAAAYPTVWVSGVSHAILAGGNEIDAEAASATAIQLDHGSSLVQGQDSDLGPVFAGAPLANAPNGDTIIGNGLIEVQSDMELGTGATTPSTWTGNITTEQNSAFRMDGGITITGLVSLQQGSNGFFNNNAGGLNVVGNGVRCPWTTNAGSHVSAPQKVLFSPTGAQAVTVGDVSPDCLGF